MDNTKIIRIPIMKAIDIITNLEPKGLFISKAGGQILAIDNSTGDAYTHKCIDENKAIKWLKNDGKETIRRFTKGIYQMTDGRKIIASDIAVTTKEEEYVVAKELFGEYKTIIIPLEVFNSKCSDDKYKYELIKQSF